MNIDRAVFAFAGLMVKWSRLSEQNFRFAKWSPAGVRLPSGVAAG